MDPQTKEYVDQQISHLHDIINHRIEAHNREHEMLREADTKAEKGIDERFKMYNNFREQITQERGDYVRRDVMDERLAALQTYFEAQMGSLQSLIKPLEQMKTQVFTVVAVVGFLITLLSLFLKFVVQ